MHIDFGNRSGVAAFGPEPPPVRQNEIQPSVIQPARHVESGRKVSWQAGLALRGRQCSHVPPRGCLLGDRDGSTGKAQVFLAA
jgi:hypothetical protein